ncbi:serine hydrolase domain-containing protein [Streptomyces boncukensis]|uniref:Beta-lactamase family protein n=1 Tax=Streptomyces boncukensis TaxID=2711219 RepID=A0A6G4WSR1_9ACTN|nr:beta-lactamase family protein [Streptomyces boncukensis]
MAEVGVGSQAVPGAGAGAGAEAAVHGTVAEGYEPVRDAFVRNFRERGETGAAVTVHRHGRKVVDLWGGVRDPEDPESAPWEADTPVVLHSATKGPAAAVLHLLHQRGQLDLDAPVGTYWPEFTAHGKDRVLVRQLLAHRAGLPVLDTPLTPARAVDGVSGPRALQAQRPVWRPGTDHGYHPHTYSWLLAELVRRVTGGSRTIGRWFDDEIARPLGLDLWLGLPERIETSGRVARIAYVPAPPPPRGGLRTRPRESVAGAYADPDSLTSRAFGAIAPGPDENDPAYRAAGLPGSAGIGTARALSRFYAALIAPLPDGGPRLFTPATLTQARSEESSGPDRVLVVATRFGLGFMLHGPAAPMLAPGSFGHPGRGGSLGFADPESGTAFAYVTGTMHKSVTNDPRPQAVLRALRAAASG